MCLLLLPGVTHARQARPDPRGLALAAASLEALPASAAGPAFDSDGLDEEAGQSTSEAARELFQAEMRNSAMRWGGGIGALPTPDDAAWVLLHSFGMHDGSARPSTRYPRRL